MTVGSLLDKEHQPTPQEIQAALGAAWPLWESLTGFLANTYAEIPPELSFGGKKYGWNLWYRKSGKSLLSLFPNEGYFVAQIVLGNAQVEQALLLELGENVGTLLRETPQFHDGRWLFIPVRAERDVADVQQLLQVKRRSRPTRQSLSATAYWTAAVRALENERADRLFSDQWAKALAGEAGAAWIAQRTPESVVPIVLRTRYFDDFLLRIAEHENIRQIVILAAGLDTRAFRLTWPAGIRFFELDQENILGYKAHVLGMAGAKPAGERSTIAVDLTGKWQDVLVKSDFDPELPAGWLLEGFLYYLGKEKLVKILDEVCSLTAPGSWLGFDIVNSLVLTSPLTRKWVEMQAQEGAPWIGTMDDPLKFLAARGWKASIGQAGAADANYGRWTLPVIPVQMAEMPHNWYVTAQKG
jgi:methyltransferase (TIGR00027 family)